MKKAFLISFVLLLSAALHAQEVRYIPVCFLYGSRPAPQYRAVEKPWFGGLMGGHVGVGIDSSHILNFGHTGAFHVVSNRHHRHSRFFFTTPGQFRSIFGGDSTGNKTLTIWIPATREQCNKLDSLSKCYCTQSPYDYALFGMRCAAASYDLLAHASIMPHFAHSLIYKKVFYPKLLRKMMIKKAEENGWAITRQQGSDRRIWESD